jgi:hypothetical protein
MYTTKSFFDKIPKNTTTYLDSRPLLNYIVTSWGFLLNNTKKQLLSLITSNIINNSIGTVLFKNTDNSIIFEKTIYINDNIGTLELNGTELNIFEKDNSYKITSYIVNDNGKKSNTLTITFQTSEKFKINNPVIDKVWTSFGEILTCSKNDIKIYSKIINVLEDQVGTIKIVHDNIIDFIFKNKVYNGVIEINIPKELLIAFKKDIIYKIVVDINNEDGVFAETHDTTTFTVNILIIPETITKKIIADYTISEPEINFYKNLLEKIDLLILRAMIAGQSYTYVAEQASYLKQDISIRYDIILYGNREKIYEIKDMDFDILHDIQVEIYGIELEYKRYNEKYGETEIEDMEINKLREIEKDLYKNTIDRIIYYQTHNTEYIDDIENLSNIHISLYGDNLEFIIYKELYGDECIEDDKIQQIINDIFT